MQKGAAMDSQPITPAAIFQVGLGFFASKTLLSAVELGVFTELARGPKTAEELRVRLGLHPRSVRDFLDALVALRMLQRDGEQYSNTAETDLFLERTKPSYVGGLLEMANARLYRNWGHLTEALRTGKPQNEAGGEDLFSVLYADPEKVRGFAHAMTGASAALAGAIAAQFPWSKARSFADIGCAEGGATVAIAAAHPRLSAIGFDLPPVQPVFEAYVRSRGLQDRVRFQPGDLFKDPLPNTDVIVMGHMLHGWDLPTKRMLLGKAHGALPDGGSLLVYDTIIDDDRRENAFGLLMSLNMLLETQAGFDYTGADCISWMREAGFRDARIEPLPGSHSVAIATK
jgi:SAM-dependent methyltransferase